MKRIILAFENDHFSDSAFSFARCLNEMEPVLLTGIFLTHLSRPNIWSYAEGVTGPLFVPFEEGPSPEAVQENINRFEKACQSNNIDYRVHKDMFDFALPELKRETRFADLLIVGSDLFYQQLGDNLPNEFLKDLFHYAECPVVLVPQKFELPTVNVLSYDGSDSAVFAIKQFSYLFPGFRSNKTLLVYANEGNSREIPDMDYIEELATRHFSDLTFLKMVANHRQEFSDWVGERKEAILVTGAFSRSLFSEMVKKSFISGILKEQKLPIFIAHR